MATTFHPNLEEGGAGHSNSKRFLKVGVFKSRPGTRKQPKTKSWMLPVARLSLRGGPTLKSKWECNANAEQKEVTTHIYGKSKLSNAVEHSGFHVHVRCPCALFCRTWSATALAHTRLHPMPFKSPLMHSARPRESLSLPLVGTTCSQVLPWHRAPHAC